MSSLRTTSEEHHARLLTHVDRLLVLADMVGHVDCAAVHTLFEEEHAFIVGQLVPHMEAIESALYDRIEALLGRHHSMAPMRAEHEAMRAWTSCGTGSTRTACRWSAVGWHCGVRCTGCRDPQESTWPRKSSPGSGRAPPRGPTCSRGIDHAMTEPL
jgi:hypothetical protein